MRPTHDRIRETVFNWLQFHIVDAVCLDLFAGSGALGFEALSRGAKEVVFVDSFLSATQSLKENAQRLKANHAFIYSGDFRQITQRVSTKKFDLVFLDPPFRQNLLSQASRWLEENQLLNTSALIYIETEKEVVLEKQIPKNWEIVRHLSTKTLEYGLCRCENRAPSTRG